MQAEARELLSANRLYRESVKQAGDPALAMLRSTILSAC